MSLVLIIIGGILCAVGVWFAYVNKASDKAGGSGLKSISVEGPAWLVLVCVGLAAIGWGTYRWEETALERAKTNPDDRTEITQPPEAETGRNLADLDDFMADYPNGFTYGDNRNLDLLWDECSIGRLAACDDLYFASDIDSDYEWFGATCGQPDFREPSDLWCDPARNTAEGLAP